MKIMRRKKGQKTIFEKIGIAIAILIVVVILRSVIIFVLEKTNQILFPVQSKIYTTASGTRENIDILTHIKEIFYENKELKDKIVKEEYKDEVIKTLKEENERLRKLLDIKKDIKYKVRAAKVSFRHSQEVYNNFAIILGSEDGIKKDMIVLNGRTVIGKVSKVYEKYSMVKMVTGEKSFVSSVVNDEILGLTSGQLGEDLLFTPTSDLDKDINIGDEVYTSGIGDIYLKGLYVGVVKEIISENDGNEKSYIIDNDINIYELQEVLIIEEE